MKSLWLSLSLLLACSVLGCGTNVYTVRFTNNSPQKTDFVIDEPGGYSDDTFVPNVAGNGGKQTVTHQSRRNQTDIASGTLIGQQMVVIDAHCSAKVTDGDIVDVVKQPDGSLTCTVTPGANPQEDPRSSNRLLRGLLGR